MTAIVSPLQLKRGLDANIAAAVAVDGEPLWTTDAHTLWISQGGTKYQIGGGTGDVVGPASATDNSLALFDGTTGKLLKSPSTLYVASGSLVSVSTGAGVWAVQGIGGSYTGLLGYDGIAGGRFTDATHTVDICDGVNNITYDPATPADWDTPPTDVWVALDYLAGRTFTLGDVATGFTDGAVPTITAGAIDEVLPGTAGNLLRSDGAKWESSPLAEGDELNGGNVNAVVFLDGSGNLTTDPNFLHHLNGNVYYKPTAAATGFHIARIGTGAGNNEYWGYRFETATGVGELGCSSTNYTIGGGLPWVGDDMVFLQLPGGRFRIGYTGDTDYVMDFGTGEINTIAAWTHTGNLIISGTINYTPATSADWPTVPTTLQGGLDGLSSFMQAFLTLRTSCVAHWQLNEASGSRADVAGSNTLTDNNTVTQGTGKLGACAAFTAANSEYLSIADNAAVSTGDVDFTLACWVKLTTLADTGIMCKWDFGSDREYALVYDHTNSSGFGGTATKFKFCVSSNGTAVTGSVESAAAVSTGTWYFLLAWHDAAANTLNISVNGTVVSTSYSSGVRDGTATLYLGNLVSVYYLDGFLDSATIWKKVLTSYERAVMYSAGNGREWPL